eukprot:5494625-Pyramimonas_sp.AAC.1
MAVWSPTSLKKPISAAYASLYFVQNPSSKSACQSQGPHGVYTRRRNQSQGSHGVYTSAQEPIAGATRGIYQCASKREGGFRSQSQGPHGVYAGARARGGVQEPIAGVTRGIYLRDGPPPTDSHGGALAAGEPQRCVL